MARNPPRNERYGWIYGHVLNVSVIPATREGVMRVLTIVGLTADRPPAPGKRFPAPIIPDPIDDLCGWVSPKAGAGSSRERQQQQRSLFA